MATTRTDELLSILQEHFNPREEGWLWLATYRSDLDPGVVAQVEGEFDCAATAATSLAHIINECGADSAYLALCRREGRPREIDREMWRALRGLVSPPLLIDLVVFNERATWSMRAEDAEAA